MDRFYFWTLKYAGEYVSLVTLQSAWAAFAKNFLPIFKSAWWFWLAGVAGLAITLVRNQSGKPLDAYAGDGGIGAFSPVWRLTDGTLLQAYFHLQGKIAADGSPGEHRSLVIRSADDGKTWTGPHYLDPTNFESNDCMVIERGNGNLLAFSRALHDRFMWENESHDNGLTWTKQVRSVCPRVDHHYIIRHSSGVLLMASRGQGVLINTSPDEGKTWSRETRVGVCSGNAVMTELRDGRVLVVSHEAYRRPTRLRAHYMQVHKDGTLSAA